MSVSTAALDEIFHVMEIPQTEASGSAYGSGLYKEFLVEREQILCHKWIESEKAGCDIGFERALVDWSLKYRTAWREKRQNYSECSAKS